MIGYTLLAQDNDNIRAVQNQIKKARCIWTRVSQILRVKNTSPKVSAKFYLALVQSVLLYAATMEPDKGSTDMAGWIQYSCWVQNVGRKKNPQRTAPCVGVPALK